MKKQENDLIYEINFKNLSDKMSYSDKITIMFFSNFLFIYLVYIIQELYIQILISIFIIIFMISINSKMWKIKCFENEIYIQKKRFNKIEMPYYELKYNEIKSIKLNEDKNLEIKFNWEKFNGDKITEQIEFQNISQTEYKKLKKIINSKK